MIRAFKKVGDGMRFKNRSYPVEDDDLIRSFTNDPGFPYLVSFPRTGSHWLRMVMELYFEKPSLTRIFFYRKATDFTCCHSHDMELSLERRNVIYLYRDPVATVYSQLSYCGEDIEDVGRISHWANLYGRHLAKWLILDDFTDRKTIITYEGMKENMLMEFEKVCRHFGRMPDEERLGKALLNVSKEALKKKTSHDRRVVNLSEGYRRRRSYFSGRYGALIWKEMNACHSGLSTLYPERQPERRPINPA